MVQVECSVLPLLGDAASDRIRGATGPVKVHCPLSITPCQHANQHHLESSPVAAPASENQYPGSVTAALHFLQQSQDVSMKQDMASLTADGIGQSSLPEAGSVPQPRSVGKGKRKGRPEQQHGQLSAVASVQDGVHDDLENGGKHPRPDLEHYVTQIQR